MGTKYLLVIEDDVEPFTFGPFSDDESRDRLARYLRRQDPEKNNGIYWAEIEINPDGIPLLEVGPFSGGFFEGED